jgi:nitrite reductase/ring-hydroxylating ferredoxin subunit
MSNREALFKLDELPDGESRAISLHIDGREREMFAVRTLDEFFVYENSCPHTGATLNWSPDQFLSEDKTVIQCANHDARFTIEDGTCVAGPCAGQALKPVQVRVREGVVYLADT